MFSSAPSSGRKDARAKQTLAGRHLPSLRRTTATAMMPPSTTTPARPSRPLGATPPSNGRGRKSRPDRRIAKTADGPVVIRKRSKSSEISGTALQEAILPRSITEGGLLHGENLDATSPPAEEYKPHTPKGSGERFRGRARRVSPQQFLSASPPGIEQPDYNHVDQAADDVPEPLSDAAGGADSTDTGAADGDAAVSRPIEAAVPSGEEATLAITESGGALIESTRAAHSYAGATPSGEECLREGFRSPESPTSRDRAPLENANPFAAAGTAGNRYQPPFGAAEEDPYATNDAMLRERLAQAKMNPPNKFGFALWNKGKVKEPSVKQAQVPTLPLHEVSGEDVSARASEIRINPKCDELRSTSATGEMGGTFEDPKVKRNARESIKIKSPLSPEAAEMHRRLVDVKADTPREFHWRLGEQIGRGSFGRVFRGLNERSGELFAVKQVPLCDESTKDAEALVTEISVMKALEHDHIVRYLGTQMLPEQGLVCIFMEYVPGGSIASMLAQFGVFKEDLIRRYIEQVLLGLKYLHGKGIVHRDIKGANILVGSDGACKLSDFGKK